MWSDHVSRDYCDSVNWSCACCYGSDKIGIFLKFILGVPSCAENLYGKYIYIYF